jgi:hypothetical protein
MSKGDRIFVADSCGTSKPGVTPRRRLDVRRRKSQGLRPKIELRDGLPQTDMEFSTSMRR